MRSVSVSSGVSATGKKGQYNFSSVSGYTLLEMAIAILVVGIVMGTFFSAYTTYVESKKMVQTETSLAQLTAAIGNFRAQYGRYPCPASLSAPADNPQYGREAASGCADEAQVAIGACDMGAAVGYCVERSARQIDTDGVGGPDTFPRVRRGAIPFKNLNIPEEYTYDGHGNRMVYAVTERLAVTNTFQPDHGGIDIVDDATPPGSVLFAPDVAHFLVLSPGENNTGGYSNSGVQIQPCPNPAASVEGNNCDTENNRARYVLTGLRTTNDNTRYDDRMAYFSQAEFSLWQRTAADRNNIEQRPGGIAGINATPDEGVPVVNGTIRALDRVFASQLCNDDVDPASAKCFDAAMIGGAGIECAVGYVTAIKDGELVCKPGVTAGCGKDFMVEVAPDGTPVCKKVSLCPAVVHTFCPSTKDALPAGNDGDVVFGPTTGIKFTCKAPKWKPASGSPPTCCVPSDKTAPAGCPTGYSGGRLIRTVRTCLPTTTTPTVVADTCTCVGATIYKNSDCPLGQIGLIQEKAILAPDPLDTSHPIKCVQGKWLPHINTCELPPVVTCVLKPVNQTGSVNTNSMPTPQAGQQCGCGSANVSCFTTGIPGVSYNKHNCRCDEL